MFLPLAAQLAVRDLEDDRADVQALEESVVPLSQNVRPLTAENCALERIEIEEERIVEQARGQPAATRDGVVLAGPAARNEMPVAIQLDALDTHTVRGAEAGLVDNVGLGSRRSRRS